MQILSSVPERTIMSLQSFMAGFFPPPLLDMTLPVYWQPFTFSIDTKAEALHFDLEVCPKYGLAIMEQLNNPPEPYRTWLAQDQEALEELSRLFALDLSDGFNFIYALDLVNAKHLMGEDTPAWAVQAYQNTLSKYENMTTAMSAGDENTMKVRGGFVIREIVENMEAIISGSEDAKEFMIYSAHDGNVIIISQILDVVSQVPIPQYGATIVMDLVDTGASELQVQIFYVDNSENVPDRFALNMPGCGFSCNFSTFKGLVQKYMVSDMTSFCAL